jgi:hypothetical protein
MHTRYLAHDQAVDNAVPLGSGQCCRQRFLDLSRDNEHIEL